MRNIAEEIRNKGFALVRDLAPPAEIAGLKGFFEHAGIARAKRGPETFGARNLLGFGEIRQIAAYPSIASQLSFVLGPRFQAVGGIFFDKTEHANWPVTWHQDLSLAVRDRHELPGWSGWSVKRGVLHVQPPAGILEQMVTIRIHLDDCPAENGALRVLAGSHLAGRLSRADIRSAVADGDANVIPAAAGDVLFMRPLILHASSPSVAPAHRRVLHLEYAPSGLLPAVLAWAEAA
jgi:ectoine hydroxylase-related dioxygenase (phytanoyl-CoA dioxygenase family)